MSRLLRIGTRGSALALRQTGWVAGELRRLHPGLETELVTLRTSGDRFADRPLAEIGGKGLFVKEIEEALLAGEVDAGVHSMKDLPGTLPPGLSIAAVPVREDARDALVWSGKGGLAALPHGARVGTGSLRRTALLRALRPDLEVVPLRGNVDTRLGRWRKGELDAVVLAAAGLARLGLDLPEAEPLSAEDFVPAIGQGALALEARDDSPWREVLAAFDDSATATAVAAERAFLAAVGGDCKTPIAAHAVFGPRGAIELSGLIASPDGRRILRSSARGASADAALLGRTLAEELLAAGGREILAELRR